MSNNIKKIFINAIQRKNFYEFFKKSFEITDPGTKLIEAPYLEVMCWYMEQVALGKEKRLIFCIPPRHCKSKIISIAFPAFYLGLNPSAKIMHITYSEELSTDLAINCKKIMESEWYKKLFPNTRIDPKKSSATDFRTTRNGEKFSTTIHGAITGRGADLIIIDDPLKASDVNSSERENVNKIYSNTIVSRLNDKKEGQIVIVAQRLHQLDLPAYAQNLDPQFKTISMPIIAQKDEEWIIEGSFFRPTKKYQRKKGDLLHPAREDISIIENYKRCSGSAVFSAQYLQNPLQEGCGYIKKEMLQKFSCSPACDTILLSWDTATKISENNAYSACVVLGIDRKNYFLLGCVRERLDFPALVQKVKDTYKFYNKETSFIKILIEDASSGTSLIQTLKSDPEIGRLICPIRATRAKEDRFNSVTLAIENGKLLLPEYGSNWYPEFEQELLTFPYSIYKDQCDALSQAVEYANTHPSAQPHRQLLIGVSTGYCQDISPYSTDDVSHLAVSAADAIKRQQAEIYHRAGIK